MPGVGASDADEKRGRPRPGILPKGRPQPLVDHLAAHAGAEVVLTFAEIEAIVGGALPVSAYVLPGAGRARGPRTRGPCARSGGRAAWIATPGACASPARPSRSPPLRARSGTLKMRYVKRRTP